MYKQNLGYGYTGIRSNIHLTSKSQILHAGTQFWQTLDTVQQDLCNMLQGVKPNMGQLH